MLNNLQRWIFSQEPSFKFSIDRKKKLMKSLQSRHYCITTAVQKSTHSITENLNKIITLLNTTITIDKNIPVLKLTMAILIEHTSVEMCAVHSELLDCLHCFDSQCLQDESHYCHKSIHSSLC